MLRHRQRGMTILEIVVALVIVAMLTTLALPTYRLWIQNQNIRNAAEALSNGLQLARAEAIKRNKRVQLVLTAEAVGGTGVGYTVTELIQTSANVFTCGQLISVRDNNEGARTARLTLTPLDATTVTFGPLGSVVDGDDCATAGAGNPITQIDIGPRDATITDARALRTTIGAAGSVRTCDPAAATGDPRAC